MSAASPATAASSMAFAPDANTATLSNTSTPSATRGSTRRRSRSGAAIIRPPDAPRAETPSRTRDTGAGRDAFRGSGMAPSIPSIVPSTYAHLSA